MKWNVTLSFGCSQKTYEVYADSYNEALRKAKKMVIDDLNVVEINTKGDDS